MPEWGPFLVGRVRGSRSAPGKIRAPGVLTCAQCTVVYIQVYTCIGEWGCHLPIYVYVKARGQCWLSFSLACHWGDWLSNKKHPESSCVCLPAPRCSHSALLFPWMLGNLSSVLCASCYPLSYPTPTPQSSTLSFF